MKKQRFSVRDDRLQQSIGAELNNQGQVGEGRLESLPVNIIHVSPLNPRYVGRLSPEEVIAHRKGEIDLTQRSEEQFSFFTNISEMALSITKRGLLQPIVVTEDGDGFVILVGERRFLAHLLLGKERIRAIIRPQSEELQERSIRLVENLQREDLSFPEIIRGIDDLDRLFQDQHGRPMDSKELAAEIHKHDSQCRRYLQVVRGPSDIREAVEQGKITGLRPALALLEFDTQQKRADILNNLGKVDATENLLRKPTIQAKMTPAAQSGKRGRQKSQVNLGAVKKVTIIQHILRSIIGEDTYRERYGLVEWDNFESVQKIWDEFLKGLEKQV